jgi:hypothetical protein
MSMLAISAEKREEGFMFINSECELRNAE